MKTSRSEFISVRGRCYHVRIWGENDAPVLFFLHGWGDTSVSFQFIVDALEGRWQIIAPDWRGFGLSQWNIGPYWFPDYIADFDALLEHYSPNAPARIVGHSMGGIVASLYAGIRPDRVSLLASLEGFALWVAASDESPGRFATWLRQIRNDNPAFRRYQQRDEFSNRMLADNPRLDARRAAFLADHLLKSDGNGFVFSADPQHRWINPVLYPLEDAKACWRLVTAQTLWIVGRESEVMHRFDVQPNDYQERLACFARVREVIVDNCGHNLHHDQPETVAALLDEFFS